MKSILVYPGADVVIDLAITKNKILRVVTGLDLKFPEGQTEEFKSYTIVNRNHMIIISPSFGENTRF